MEKHTTAPTPPMGWNSWNTFYDQISDELIRTTADAMVEQGLLAAGYEYLIIDDCWSEKQRDAQGKLVPDPVKFPNGIKAVADYVHSKGLKLGIYSCCGVRTCAGYPGSFEHEFSDAAQFAQWGVDYLKYDNCHRPTTLTTPMLYRRMSMALRSSGREILLAACQWGTDDVHRWIRSSGAHTFRSTVDIQDSWKSIETIALSQMNQQCFNGSDCFNDMDMLVVGMYGKGMNPETSMGGCSDTEYQTHFALWAMMNSPLIIGCDVRSMSEKTREILTNQELIAINQDPECRSCCQLPVYANPDAFVLVKPLQGNQYALGFFNFSDTAANVPLDFWDMGLSAHSGHGLHFHDCLTHEDLGLQQEIFVPVLPPHGCKVYRCSVEETAL
jgi:alpha-galactosidase